MPKEPPRAYNPELPEGPDNPRPKGGEVVVSAYEAWQQRERQRRLGAGSTWEEDQKQEQAKARKGGRPPTVIDWNTLDDLCGLGCTLEEIAGTFGCDPDTIQRAIRKTWNLTFKQYWTWKSAGLKVSLRRAQIRLALGGNVLMQMFLGKQLLNQRDTPAAGALGDDDDENTKNPQIQDVYGITFVGAPGDENTHVAPPDAVRPYNVSQPQTAEATPAESAD